MNRLHNMKYFFLIKKKVFKQHLQRSKQQSSSQLQHGKQSPLQGDHSTFSQYYPAAYSQTKPVPIPQVPSSPKNPMHTRKSVEGLNIELAGLEFDDKVDQVSCICYFAAIKLSFNFPVSPQK